MGLGEKLSKSINTLGRKAENSVNKLGQKTNQVFRKIDSGILLIVLIIENTRANAQIEKDNLRKLKHKKIVPKKN